MKDEWYDNVSVRTRNLLANLYGPALPSADKVKQDIADGVLAIRNKPFTFNEVRIHNFGIKARNELMKVLGVEAMVTGRAFDRQVGGEHYKHLKIQPTEFIERNGLSFLEGCVVKRICRHRGKNGREDLEKAKHEIDMLIELNYPQGDNDEPTQGQSHAEGSEGDERGTHTSVSPEHERGYTLHATDLAKGRQGAVLPVVPRS